MKDMKDLVERLQRDLDRDVISVEVQGIKRENTKLKQLIAWLSLQVHVLKNDCSWARVKRGMILFYPKSITLYSAENET